MDSKSKFPNIGEKLGGRFRLVFGRGAGPNAVVFKALDLLQDLPVAVKVFKPELFQSAFREQNLYRLYRARTYQDPNLVRIFEVLEDQGFYFITCQLIEGMSLQAIFDLHAESGEYFTVPKIRAVMNKICDGVESIHRKGAIHGNLKPQNIFVMPERLVLSDPFYLLASQLKEDQEIPLEDYYRAPEQLIDPAKETPQIDIYALGLIFGEILGGNPVKPEVRLSEQVPRLTSRFDELFSVATAFRAEERYSSVEEFRNALMQCLDVVESEGLWKRRYHETGSFRAIKLKATQEEQKIEPVKPASVEVAKAVEAEKTLEEEPAVSPKEEKAEEKIVVEKETLEQAPAVVQAESHAVSEAAVEPPRAEPALEEAGTTVVLETRAPEHVVEDKVAIESAVKEVEEIEDISKTVRIEVPEKVEKVEDLKGEEKAPARVETVPPEIPEEALEEVEEEKIGRETVSFEAAGVALQAGEAKETTEGIEARVEEIEGIEISEGEVVEEGIEGVEVVTEEMPPAPPPQEPKTPVTVSAEPMPEAKSGVLEMESVAKHEVVPPAERMARKPVVMAPREESPFRTFLLLFLVFVVVGGGAVGLYSLMKGKGGEGKEEGGEPSKQAVVETPKAVATAKDAVVADKGTDTQGAQVATTTEPRIKEGKEAVPKKRTLAEIATCPPMMSKVVLNSEVAEGSNVPLKEVGFCIDTFEYPGKGEAPKGGVSKTTASDLCKKSGKRLCTLKEWRKACGEKLPYGDSYEEGVCNVSGGKLKASGSSGKCASRYGVYDMVGNASEWVQEGVLAGGDAGTGKDATCSTTSKRFLPGPLNGFRCCADLSL